MQNSSEDRPKTAGTDPRTGKATDLRTGKATDLRTGKATDLEPAKACVYDILSNLVRFPTSL